MDFFSPIWINGVDFDRRSYYSMDGFDEVSFLPTLCPPHCVPHGWKQPHPVHSQPLQTSWSHFFSSDCNDGGWVLLYIESRFSSGESLQIGSFHFSRDHFSNSTF